MTNHVETTELAVRLDFETLAALWRQTGRESDAVGKAITWHLINRYLKPEGNRTNDFWQSFVDLCRVVAGYGYLSENVAEFVLMSTAPSHLRKEMDRLLDVSKRAYRARKNGSLHSDQYLNFGMSTILTLWRLDGKSQRAQAQGVTTRLFEEFLNGHGKPSDEFWDAFVTLCEVVAHNGYLDRSVVRRVLVSDANPELRARMNELLDISHAYNRAQKSGVADDVTGESAETQVESTGEAPEVKDGEQPASDAA